MKKNSYMYYDIFPCTQWLHSAIKNGIDSISLDSFETFTLRVTILLAQIMSSYNIKHINIIFIDYLKSLFDINTINFIT